MGNPIPGYNVGCLHIVTVPRQLLWGIDGLPVLCRVVRGGILSRHALYIR